jgi:hypothetical protein
MFVTRKRLLLALALLAVPAALLALPGRGRAADIELKPGEYPGCWHDDKVHFIIEKVEKDGVFSGKARFDKNSNFPDAVAPFTGKLDKDGSITINREDCKQTSHAKAPKKTKDHLVWEGKTSGDNLPKGTKLIFELHVPLK